MRKKIVVSIVVLAVAGGVPLLLSWCNADDRVLDRMSDHLLTLLSILAGFMVAVMAAVGDHALQFSADEEFADGEARRAGKWLELGYIHVIFLLCLVSVLLIVLAGPISVLSPSLGRWWQLFSIFISLLAAFISLGLPFHFLRLHQERIERASAEHRQAHRERLSP